MFSDTVIEKYTVMIEFLDAALASFAMVTSFFHVDFAIVAFFEFLVGFGK